MFQHVPVLLMHSRKGTFSNVRPLLRGKVARGRCIDTGFVDVHRDLLLFHRWRLIWAAPLTCPEVIHVCETRGLFSLIRNLSRESSNVGLEILILTDSMCVSLATDPVMLP